MKRPKILPDGYVIDYTGESRQLRVEGNTFLPAFSLAVILIFLVLAAQFNSFRDPFIILLGSVPLAIFGALIFTFLKMPNPNLPFLTDGWTTTMNIYSQVGLVTLIGLVSKNGILMVEFANQLQLQGTGQAGRHPRGVDDPAAAHPDDQCGDRLRSLSPGPGDRGRGRGPQQHRPGDRGRHVHRNLLHPFRGALALYALRQGSLRTTGRASNRR